MKTTPRRIVAQPYDFSVQDLVDKITSKDIDLNPDYQRNYVWETGDESENKRSRLIESLLLNIPIPVIYFAEQAETLKYEVIDGQQRLRTFELFLNDGFKLERLEIRDDVNGKFYSGLDQKDKNEIRKRSIRAIVVLNESDEEIKFEVFERLNLGSIQLTPQEIRNNTYRGRFNSLLKELANDKLFRSMIEFRLHVDKTNMAHEELILRFFAHNHNSNRTEHLSYFLTKYMKDNKDISEDEISKLRRLFNETINKINKYLGDNAFSTFRVNGNQWNKKINRALFDAEMLAFAQVSDDDIRTTPEQFQEELKKLMEDPEFKKGLSQQSGGARIEERVESVKSILTGLK